MTKLEWCKANAPTAMKDSSDEELLEYMGSAYDKFCNDNQTSNLIMRNATWKQLCNKYPDTWLFLKNIEFGDYDEVIRADLVDFCSPQELSDYYLKHMDKDDYERHVFTGRLYHLRAGGVPDEYSETINVC